MTYESPLGREKALCQDGLVFKDDKEAHFITVRQADQGVCESLGIVMGGGGSGKEVSGGAGRGVEKGGMGGNPTSNAPKITNPTLPFP